MAETLIKEAKEYLEAMKEHKTCCGTSIIKRLVEALEKGDFGESGNQK